MPNLVELRRTATQFAIDQSPTSITISRTTESVDSTTGQTRSTKSTVGPFIVRITQIADSEWVSDTGGRELRALRGRHRLLANYLADIQASTSVQDTFEANGRWYKVAAVAVQRVGQEITSVQANLEVM